MSEVPPNRREMMASETERQGVVQEVVLDGQQGDDDLIEQLRVVFDACDTEGLGLISLRELANISRSHVGRGQVDQILNILDPGEETQDRIDFDQFYKKFVEYMNSGDKKTENAKVTARNNHNTNMVNLNLSPSRLDMGEFNENLRRSFEKNTISSPNCKKVEKRNLKRKSSQARLSGLIPLVNTSSEEDDAEDSFDRKIASSLAMARPMDIQPQFLVRGSCARNTVRKHSNPSNQPSPTMSTSTRKFSATSRTSPSSTLRMSPILAPSEGSSFTSPMSSCSTPSDRSDCGSAGSGGRGTRLALDELEKKVANLANKADGQQEEYDSHSSGVGSSKADLEEQISSSILLARKHGEERLDVERQRNIDQLGAMERERDLERRNFQLMFEQFQEEQEKLKRKVDNLTEKVKLVNLEKKYMEEQIRELVKHQGNEVVKITQNNEEKDQFEQRRIDREEELMQTVKSLTERVQNQDEDLAEAKEDNIVLKSQVKTLKECKGKECKEGRFKLFRSGKENTPVEDQQNADPQDIRVKLRMVEQELGEQKEVNCKLKHYVGEVLADIMVKNPQMLEKN